jgi:hypothetical protein
MKTIFIKFAEFQKKHFVLLTFPFDFELKEMVKTLAAADWEPALKAWTIPYSDAVIPNLLSIFEGKVWLDYSGFKKVKIEAKPKGLPALGAELALEIQKFTDWMRNRRYSESTIKNYSQGVGLFFRFMGNRNPERGLGTISKRVYNKKWILGIVSVWSDQCGEAFLFKSTEAKTGTRTN